MEEAARRGADMDHVADPLDAQFVERLDRARRLAMDRTKGGEVARSEQLGRAFSHRVEIERGADVPHLAAQQGGRGAMIEDAVEIAPTAAGKACVPVVGDMSDLKHRYRVRPHQRIES